VNSASPRKWPLKRCLCVCVCDGFIQFVELCTEYDWNPVRTVVNSILNLYLLNYLTACGEWSEGERHQCVLFE